MEEKRKHEFILWGTVIGGGVVLFIILEPHTSGKPVRTTSSPPRGQPYSSHPQTMPNPQQASVDEAFLQARSQALAMFDQTVLGEKSVAAQQQVMNNETIAQKQIAFNQDSTAYKISSQQTTAQETIANAQIALERALGTQQLNIQQQAIQTQQTQQGNSWWQNILGGIANFLPMIFGGFNFMGMGGMPLQGSTGQPTSGGANQNPPY